MAFGPAYFSDLIRDPCAARDSDIFRRLSYGGPWSFADAMHDGKRGVLAFWDDGKGVPIPAAYGTPRTCADGLVYFHPSPMVSQSDLAKSHAIPGIDFTTSRGVTLTIPLAAGAALEVSFATEELGGPADDFARLGWEVHAEQENITLGDKRIVRLVYLAIAQNYRITPELLDDLRWITSRDFSGIFSCLMGSDPKALAAAGATSPSSAPASSESRA